MGNCASSSVCRTNRSSVGPDELEAGYASLLANLSEQPPPFTIDGGRTASDAAYEAEQNLIHALSEFAVMPNSAAILGTILERECTMTPEFQHHSGMAYETLARMMLREAYALARHHNSVRATEEQEVATTGPPPAAEETIQMLPKTTWKTTKSPKNDQCHKCGVCHDNYVDDDLVKRLPCGHIFHASCIDAWLKEHCTCPLCRHKLPKGGILNVYTQRLCSTPVGSQGP